MNRDAKIVLLMVSLLLMIGVVMIYSSSAVYALNKYGDSLFFVKKHLVFLFAGLTLAFFFMAVPSGLIRDKARLIMAFSLALLVLVLIPGIGSQIAGARRWIRVLGFGIQPSEIAKIALILYLADLTSRKRYLMGDLRNGFLPATLVIGLTGALVFLEPDMGTSVAICFVGFMLLFVSGVKMRYLFFLAACMVPAVIAAVIAAPYRMRRMTAFFDPWADARGAGFQLIQSFIALGSGGVFGVGLGGSKQKLFYLPESHTDFIFSIVGEELGFIGAGSVLMIFLLLIWYILKLSFRVKDMFASRAIMGIGIMIAFEVIVNIGVSTGILPTKGLPLPFISYGGSSLVCHLVAMGIVFNLSRQAETCE